MQRHGRLLGRHQPSALGAEHKGAVVDTLALLFANGGLGRRAAKRVAGRKDRVGGALQRGVLVLGDVGRAVREDQADILVEVDVPTFGGNEAYMNRIS